LALVAFSAFAANASAAITTSGGTYTATTTSNQTLTAPTIFGTLTISCSQRATLNVTGGTYNARDIVGNASAVTFSCGSGSSATALNLPWPLQLTGASTSVLSATINNVQVSVSTIVGTCLFSGSIPFSVNNNSTTGNLAGGTLTYVSGPCTGNGSVSSAGYSVSPSFSYTGTA
jgi:hypothetical protein